MYEILKEIENSYKAEGKVNYGSGLFTRHANGLYFTIYPNAFCGDFIKKNKIPDMWGEPEIEKFLEKINNEIQRKIQTKGSFLKETSYYIDIMQMTGTFIRMYVSFSYSGSLKIVYMSQSEFTKELMKL